MSAEPKTVRVGPDTELADMLDLADQAPVRLVKGGEVYLLQHEGQSRLPRVHDPERVREGLRRSAGALKGVDIAELLEDLRAEREQDSHGRPAE